MKKETIVILCFNLFLIFLSYRMGFMTGHESIQFDVKIANQRLQSCLDVIR